MTEVHAERPPRALRALLIALTPVLWIAIPLFHPAQTARAGGKAVRQQTKWVWHRKRGLEPRDGKEDEKPESAEAQALSKEERAMQKEAKKAKPKGAKTKTEKAGFVKAEKAVKAKRQP